MNELGHIESSLLRFVDRSLPIQAVLSLGAEYLNESEERVALALDSLVSNGHLSFENGSVGLPKKADDMGMTPIIKLYQQWQDIVRRHPEWTMRATDDESISVNPADPQGTMDSLKGRVDYDPSSVHPQDREEFERFLDIDRQIQVFEDQHGYNRDASLTAQKISRAVSLWRMAGGKVRGIGIVANKVRRVRSTELGLGRGDIVLAIAEDMSEGEHGCPLGNLPLDQQMVLLHRAEQQALDRFPLVTKADFGMPALDGSDEAPPPPDPEKAPNGWDAIVGPDGKKQWRSKTDPNTKLIQPDPNAT